MDDESGRQGSLVDNEYDKKIKEYGWVGSEIAFGLAYEYTSPGQTILDIGIGTGLGSVLFHKAGMVVYGLDNSEAMLDICRGKDQEQRRKSLVKIYVAIKHNTTRNTSGTG